MGSEMCIRDSGTYSFGVSAEDASGNFIEAGTFSAGVISDIIFEEGKTFAVVNGQKVSVNEISKVSF